MILEIVIMEYTRQKLVLFMTFQYTELLTLLSVMLASHCPEVDTRRSYEYGILNFVPNFDISQSATADVISMPTEGYTIALEHNTKVPRRYYEGNNEM